ncbi:hypothetical protein MHYP_G00114730 [Metynnis hypsauchen]
MASRLLQFLLPQHRQRLRELSNMWRRRETVAHGFALMRDHSNKLAVLKAKQGHWKWSSRCCTLGLLYLALGGLWRRAELLKSPRR